jgi:hypothetical protein
MQRAGVMDFVFRERSNLIRGDFGDGDGLSVESGKLDHEVLAAFVRMDDCTDIAYREAVLRQINRQGYTIEFSNHTGKG